jgi:hypothetical protein
MLAEAAASAPTACPACATDAQPALAMA